MAELIEILLRVLTKADPRNHLLGEHLLQSIGNSTCLIDIPNLIWQVDAMMRPFSLSTAACRVSTKTNDSKAVLASRHPLGTML